MSKYEIKNLSHVSFDKLAQAHNLAFSDYVTPMHTTAEQMESYFKVSGVVLNQSFGAFFDGELIGLIANAVDEYKGKTAAWDAMTGITKEHRGHGLFSTLFEHTRQCLKNNGIMHYYLDVITTNETACSIYKGKGAVVTREFSFLTGHVKDDLPMNKEMKEMPLSEFTPQELSDYQPSFGNRMSALRRDMGNYQVVECGNSSVVISKLGRISQIKFGGREDVDSLSAIFSCMSARYDALNISNIPVTEQELIHALLEMGFKNKLNQYEMMIKL